ncbi:MAG TPA: flagellar basal body rod protein FlgB [Candidatus Baltobacteraceae bacterium]|nr:flagellar basal body rod protein FlgB [Candidatus Baltobacteraceae bacterium]
MDINAVGFGNTVDMLSNAISGADLEHSAIANNIANVNTPNYRRQSVSFKDMLAAAEQDSNGDSLTLDTNDDRQIASGGVPAGQAASFAPAVQTDDTDQMRPDGSNVDVDAEMARLSQNSGYSQTMSQLLSVQFARLREAITEQTH